MLQHAAVMWCEMHQKAWMMTTTYAWSCISLQFLKTAAHDHAIVIVTLTCSHSILLHSNPDTPSLHSASHCLLQSNIAAAHYTRSNEPAKFHAAAQSRSLFSCTKSIASCLQAHKNWVQCVSWSPDAAMVVSGDQNGVLWLWQPKTGETIGACRGISSTLFLLFSFCLSEGLSTPHIKLCYDQVVL